MSNRYSKGTAGLLTALLVLAAGCATTGSNSNAATAAGMWEEQQKVVDKNLASFDDLDFNVFSNQRWDDLHKSHAKNVVVHWPDGHTTNGIEKHIDDLKAMFVWAPDTRIKVHPIKVGQKDWTAVVGVMEGTFTKPMVTADGKTIQPTGKAYKIMMATFSHWTKEGPMDEEYLFWDNAEFNRQIGLGG
ncbi:MAG: ester cyclase [Deltaproteobacteria bacterium]|nr:ester cyclase [Deltaproteobacteria bacterium]